MSPDVVLQESWDDLGLPYGGSGMGRVSTVVFHHTPGIDPGGDLARATAAVRSILRSHVYGNGWADVGYSWLISGWHAFEGRGWGRTGAHAPGANSTSIGVAFLLDGRTRGPSDAEWATAAWLLAWGARLGWLTSTPALRGHRDFVATECPARLVYGEWTTGLDRGRRLLDGGGASYVPDTQLPPAQPEARRRPLPMDLIRRTDEDGSPVVFGWPGMGDHCWAYDTPAYAPPGAVLSVSAVRPGVPAFNAGASTAAGIEEAQLVEWVPGRNKVAAFTVRAGGFASVVVPADPRIEDRFRAVLV